MNLEALLTPENIKLLLTILIFVVIIVFIVKKMVKLAVFAVAILAIFQIGHIFTGSDINEKFGIDKYFESDVAEGIIGFFDDFSQRREENSVMKTDAIYDAMENGMAKGTQYLIDQISELDLMGFSQSLAEGLYEAGVKNIDVDEISGVLSEKLGEAAKDVDVEQLAKTVKEELSKLNDAAPSPT